MVAKVAGGTCRLCGFFGTKGRITSLNLLIVVRSYLFHNGICETYSMSCVANRERHLNVHRSFFVVMTRIINVGEFEKNKQAQNR